MERKKLLILTYYWPPAGGIAVQRWFRFVCSLREFGWEPVIYTAKDASYPILDETLLGQLPEGIKVYRLKATEPNNLLKLIFFWKKDKQKLIHNNQQQGGSQRSFFKKAAWFIRGNFLIPDARALWIKPSVKYLRKIMAEEKFDAIVSTGPPQSMHLIALKLKKEFGTPWISDFRDPWKSMDYLNEMFLTKRSRKKHARLEKEVVLNSNAVVVIGPTIYKEFKQDYNIDSHIIWNGYRNAENKNVQVHVEPDKVFSIVHAGSFYFARNCPVFWEALSELIAENPGFAKDLQIKIIGNMTPNVAESLEKNNLQKNLLKVEYMEHDKVQDHLRAAQVLLLPIDNVPNAEFVITGKLFEYLNARRPVLVIGPVHGDAAHIVRDCQAGYCCGFDDKKSMKETVMHLYSLFLEKRNNIQSVNIEQFESVKLTEKMAALLDSIIAQPSKA